MTRKYFAFCAKSYINIEGLLKFFFRIREEILSFLIGVDGSKNRVRELYISEYEAFSLN